MDIDRKVLDTRTVLNYAQPFLCAPGIVCGHILVVSDYTFRWTV
jgi:hypothetical protein